MDHTAIAELLGLNKEIVKTIIKGVRTPEGARNLYEKVRRVAPKIEPAAMKLWEKLTVEAIAKTSRIDNWKKLYEDSPESMRPAILEHWILDAKIILAEENFKDQKRASFVFKNVPEELKIEIILKIARDI